VYVGSFGRPSRLPERLYAHPNEVGPTAADTCHVSECPILKRFVARMSQLRTRQASHTAANCSRGRTVDQSDGPIAILTELGFQPVDRVEPNLIAEERLEHDLQLPAVGKLQLRTDQMGFEASLNTVKGWARADIDRRGMGGPIRQCCGRRVNAIGGEHAIGAEVTCRKADSPAALIALDDLSAKGVSPSEYKRSIKHAAESQHASHDTAGSSDDRLIAQRHLHGRNDVGRESERIGKDA